MVGERIITPFGQCYQHMPSSGQNYPYYLFTSRISQMIHLHGWQLSLTTFVTLLRTHSVRSRVPRVH